MTDASPSPSDERRSTLLTYDRLLVAIDGTAASTRILDHIGALVAHHDIELIVYRARPVAYKGVGAREVGPTPVMTAQDAAHTLTKAGIKARAIEEDVYYPDTAQSIVDMAMREDAKGIVMGSRGPGFVPAVFLGSVAYKVLHLSRQPVLVIPTD